MSEHEAIIRRLRDCAGGERTGTVMFTADECGHIIADLDANAACYSLGVDEGRQLRRDRDVARSDADAAWEAARRIRDKCVRLAKVKEVPGD